MAIHQKHIVADICTAAISDAESTNAKDTDIKATQDFRSSFTGYISATYNSGYMCRGHILNDAESTNAKDTDIKAIQDFESSFIDYMSATYSSGYMCRGHI